MTSDEVRSHSFALSSGHMACLRDFSGYPLVLFFYPKDCTPGCTREGRDFRDLYAEFQQCKTAILGVSTDTVSRHLYFKQQESFPFELLSDPDRVLCQAFDVIKNKTLFKNTFLGIERSTFLLDSKGQLVKEWRQVKVSGHAEKVLAAVKAHHTEVLEQA